MSPTSCQTAPPRINGGAYYRAKLCLSRLEWMIYQ